MSSTGAAARQVQQRRARTRLAEWVEWAAPRYAEWLASLPSIKLRLVILFGSYVKGTFEEDSDVDVLVVADGLPAITEAINLLTVGVPDELLGGGFEPHPYSPENFIASLNEGGRAATALVEGQILYIDPEFKKRLLAAL